jgi:hypothetical protein
MRNEKTSNRSGQAMIEAMIGVILILILVAGMVQFVDIARAHSRIDSRIRGDAGVAAMSPQLHENWDTPSYIVTWTPGRDGQRYTADDQAVVGSPDALRLIADHSVRANTDSDWNRFDDLEQRTSHGSSLRNMHQPPLRMIELGFAGMRGREIVPVTNIIQELIYDRPDVLVQETVWIPVTRDLY